MSKSLTAQSNVYLLQSTWNAIAAAGINPMLGILGAISSVLYLFVTFLGNFIATDIYYLVNEICLILQAGGQLLITIAALIALPLMTPIAWTVLLAITFLEIFIAGLQAYVFVTLSSMYLNDIIKLH